MYRVIFLVLIFINYFYCEDFISDFEYGQMLYDNPRGVSCSKCHGKLGNGKFITSFKDSNGKERKFYGNDISRVGIKRFKKTIVSGSRIMPRYYLTNKEVESIYKYIKKVNVSRSEKGENAKDKDYIALNDKLVIDADIIEDFEAKPKSDKNGGIISKIFNKLDDVEEADARISTSSEESK